MKCNYLQYSSLNAGVTIRALGFLTCFVPLTRLCFLPWFFSSCLFFSDCSSFRRYSAGGQYLLSKQLWSTWITATVIFVLTFKEIWITNRQQPNARNPAWIWCSRCCRLSVVFPWIHRVCFCCMKVSYKSWEKPILFV